MYIVGKSGRHGQLPLRGLRLARAGASSEDLLQPTKSMVAAQCGNHSFVIAAYSLSTCYEQNPVMHWRDSSELNIQTPLLSQLGFCPALEGFGEGERSEGEI